MLTFNYDSQLKTTSDSSLIIAIHLVSPYLKTYMSHSRDCASFMVGNNAIVSIVVNKGEHDYTV